MEGSSFFKPLKLLNIYLGDKHDVQSHRPVSKKICIFGKIFEEIIHNRIFDSVLRHKIIPEQYGFTLHRFVNSVCFIGYVLETMSNRIHVDAVFVNPFNNFNLLLRVDSLVKIGIPRYMLR